MDLLAAFAVAYVLVVALLAIVGYDDSPRQSEYVDGSRGTHTPGPLG